MISFALKCISVISYKVKRSRTRKYQNVDYTDGQL